MGSRQHETLIGKITTYAANLRVRPSPDSNAMGYINKGTLFTIIGEDKDNKGSKWYKVRLANEDLCTVN